MSLADDPEHPRIVREARLPQRPVDDVGVGTLGDVELDDLHLAPCEHVGLSRGRHPDRTGDRVRRLELGRDGKVDVQASLSPQVDVLDVRRPDHGRGARGLEARERARDEVDLVAGGARDEEIRLADSRLPNRPAAGAVRLDRADVVAVGERLEALADDVDHREVVLAVKRFHDGRADLTRAHDDDPHGRGA